MEGGRDQIKDRLKERIIAPLVRHFGQETVGLLQIIGRPCFVNSDAQFGGDRLASLVAIGVNGGQDIAPQMEETALLSSLSEQIIQAELIGRSAITDQHPNLANRQIPGLEDGSKLALNGQLAFLAEALQS